MGGRGFHRRQSRIPMYESTLPGIFPCFDLRRFCTRMGYLFRKRMGGRLPSVRGPQRAICSPHSRFPGLDPHVVCVTFRLGQVRRSGHIRRSFSLRKIGVRNRLCCPASAEPHLFQQLFCFTFCPASPVPGGVLDLVAAIIIPLSSLAGIPELATKPFGSIVQPTAQKLLGGGRRPLLQTLFAGLFLFDFIDFLSPPGREKGPRLRPFFLRNYVASNCSINLVDINLYSRVFLGKLFINGTMVLPHLMRPRPESTLVM